MARWIVAHQAWLAWYLLVVVSGLWLVAGCWWLLVVCGVVSGWLPVVSCRWLVVDCWWLVVGLLAGWQVKRSEMAVVVALACYALLLWWLCCWCCVTGSFFLNYYYF